MNWCARTTLRNSGLSDEQIEFVLSSLMAINVGPIGRFRDASFGFTQVTVVMRNDLMSGELSDIEYPSKNKTGSVTYRRFGNHLLLIPELGSPTVKAFVQKEGEDFRSIIYDYYEEEHNLFMYLNRTEQIRRSEYQMETFASVPTAELIRIFNLIAIQSATRAIMQMKPRTGGVLLADFQNMHLKVEALEGLAERFSEDERHFLVETKNRVPEIKRSLRDPLGLLKTSQPSKVTWPCG
jgi:hypothetical protein